ncbi:hypothetical protein NL676_026226 [Syzygium grande]|nr:hypothetical protein NL676_026226 [Syzygium grande]
MSAVVTMTDPIEKKEWCVLSSHLPKISKALIDPSSLGVPLQWGHEMFTNFKTGVGPRESSGQDSSALKQLRHGHTCMGSRKTNGEDGGAATFMHSIKGLVGSNCIFRDAVATTRLERHARSTVFELMYIAFVPYIVSSCDPWRRRPLLDLLDALNLANFAFWSPASASDRRLIPSEFRSYGYESRSHRPSRPSALTRSPSSAPPPSSSPLSKAVEVGAKLSRPDTQTHARTLAVICASSFAPTQSLPFPGSDPARIPTPLASPGERAEPSRGDGGGRGARRRRRRGAAAEGGRGSPEDTESQIKAAMQSRVSHFKEEADSLTFEGVRRLIEKDLGLETHALDVHKRFIKQCLLECLEGGDDNASKSSGESLQNNVSSIKGEMEELSEGPQSKNEVKKSNSGSEEKMEDSPVMGLLTAKKALHSAAEKTQGNGSKANITESTINKAIKKRAAYFRANSEKVTMAGVRRLLEKDLELEKHALDPHKKFISEHLEEVLHSPEVSKSANTVKKKGAKESLKKKTPKSVSPEGSSDSSDSEEEEDAEEDEVKPRKKTVNRGRMQKAEGLKKRKAPPAKENKVSKRIKPEEAASDSNGDSEDRGHDSEDGESHSSAERRTKKKEVLTPTYGKGVDRLKSIIKSCGMSVPPSIYKKSQASL